MNDHSGGLSPQLALVVAGNVLIIFLLFFVILKRIMKSSPNELLVISGQRRFYRDSTGRRRGINYRYLLGGATFVWPFIERVDKLSLDVIDLDMGAVDSATSDGSVARLRCSTQVKVDTSSEHSIVTAVENLLSKSPDDIKSIASNMLGGLIRTKTGTMTADGLQSGRQAFLDDINNRFEADMAKIGLQVINFSLYVD
jgi:flotillin